MPYANDLIEQMNRFDRKIHIELAREQIRHVPLTEYTDERVAKLLAQMEEAKRWWPVGKWKVNL